MEGADYSCREAVLGSATLTWRDAAGHIRVVLLLPRVLLPTPTHSYRDLLREYADTCVQQCHLTGLWLDNLWTYVGGRAIWPHFVRAVK